MNKFTFMELGLIKSDEINPQLPTEWNYNKSVQKVQGLVVRWKNISVEILRELYVPDRCYPNKEVVMTYPQMGRS